MSDRVHGILLHLVSRGKLQVRCQTRRNEKHLRYCANWRLRINGHGLSGSQGAEKHAQGMTDILTTCAGFERIVYFLP